MQAELVNEIFKIFNSKDPAPRTELNYISNFTLLVSIVLSAQATDVSVNKATSELFKLYYTPETIIELGEEGLKKYIKSIGLYNAKAKNILALCKILISEYNSEVPSSFEQLVALPGVGRKTANVLLNCAYNYPTIAVDTHVYRVARRVGLAAGSTPKEVEEELLGIVPDKWALNAHHWLILHGRYICKAQKPLCLSCPIKDYCQYFRALE
ncbi:MAG: endonuclease III [Janthinobacterium lividum]